MLWLRRIISRTGGGSRGGSSMVASTCAAVPVSRSTSVALSVSTRTRPNSQPAVVRSSTSNRRVTNGCGSVTRSRRFARPPTTVTAAATCAYGCSPLGSAASGQRSHCPASFHRGR